MEQEQANVPEYEKPEVRDYGDLRELTEGSIHGPMTDAPQFHHQLS